MTTCQQKWPHRTTCPGHRERFSLLGTLNLEFGATGPDDIDPARVYAWGSWVRLPLHRNGDVADIAEKLRDQRRGETKRNVFDVCVRVVSEGKGCEPYSIASCCCFCCCCCCSGSAAAVAAASGGGGDNCVFLETFSIATRVRVFVDASLQKSRFAVCCSDFFYRDRLSSPFDGRGTRCRMAWLGRV